MKVGGYGNPETTTGGEALAFWATGRISVRGPESKARRLSDKDGIVYGHKAIHEVIKNKLGEPFRKAELNLIYGKGYDYYNEVLDLAVSLDIIEKSGSWFKYGGNNIAQGAENSVDFLRSNEDIFNTVRDEIITSVGLKEQYELHSNPGPIYS
jgi:recombination protein RecA